MQNGVEYLFRLHNVPSRLLGLINIEFIGEIYLTLVQLSDHLCLALLFHFKILLYDLLNVIEILNFLAHFLHMKLEQLNWSQRDLSFARADRSVHLDIPGLLIGALLGDFLLISLPLLFHCVAQL